MPIANVSGKPMKSMKQTFSSLRLCLGALIASGAIVAACSHKPVQTTPAPLPPVADEPAHAQLETAQVEGGDGGVARLAGDAGISTSVTGGDAGLSPRATAPGAGSGSATYPGTGSGSATVSPPPPAPAAPVPNPQAPPTGATPPPSTPAAPSAPPPSTPH
jgi:hypothetical protein